MNVYLEPVVNALKIIGGKWKIAILNRLNQSPCRFGGLKKNPIQSLGIVNGRISKKKIGNKGFGYDPIFIPDDKRLTFGQMSQNLKFKNDHRAKAFRKIKKFL